MSQKSDIKKIWIPQREAGRLFGVEASSINRAIKRGNLQKNPQGRVDRDQVEQWVKINRKEPPPKESADQLDLFNEQAREKHFSANLKELEFQVKRGELIETEVAVDEFTKAVAVIQQRLRNIPSKLAPQIGRANAALLKSEIDEALYELSEFNPVTGKSGPPATKGRTAKRDVKAPPATRSNRKSVGKPRKKTVKRRKR